MAVGVPKRDPSGSSSKTSEIKLEYVGKRSAAEIIEGEKITPREIIPTSELNKLFFGENTRVMRHLLTKSELIGQIKLIYIDPPYATQTIFQSRKLDHAYTDMLSGADYIEFLRERLILLRELLAEDGSIYVHLDEKMIFHAKIIMDEIFGSSNYRNMITRKKCNPKNYTRNQYGNVSDYILFYSKSENYIWNKALEPWTAERAKEYQYVEAETGRRFMKVPIHAPGVRNGETGQPWRGVLPPTGKHWQFTPNTLEEMDVRGEIFWSSNGNPRRKVYLDQNPGIGVQDIWLEFRDAHNQNIRITGYPTEKNPELMKRIILASSNPGDIVLDAFAGSGTTLSVASETNRNWIGIDNSPEALRTILNRFSYGTQIMGDFVDKKNVNQQLEAKDSLFEDFSNIQTQETKNTDIQFSVITDEILETQARKIVMDAGFMQLDELLGA